MSCQHPKCSQPIHSICATHCHWSLCEKHLDDHRKLLQFHYEKALEDLLPPLEQLSKSIEEQKKELDDYQQKELQRIEENYRQQIDQLEEKFLDLDQYQDEYEQKWTFLEQIRSKPECLIIDDFQQIDRLNEQLTQQQPVPIESEEQRTNSPRRFRFQCPLTSLNVFGLTAAHRVRLCPAEKRIRYLMEHFRNYHHLNTDFANALMEAVMLNLDPTNTIIFPRDSKVSIFDDQRICPLYDTTQFSGIRCTPCSSIVTEKLLRSHLRSVHRLPMAKIKQILESI